MDKDNARENQFLLDNTNWNTSTEELSLDLRKYHLRTYALYHIRYRNHKSFARFSLLLSGDIELNPVPVKNPCTVCQGNVSIRGFFAKVAALAAIKNATLIPFTQATYVSNVKITT